MLTAIYDDWHIENRKNHKKVISLTITLSDCQCAVEKYHLFMIFAVFDKSVIACRLWRVCKLMFCTFIFAVLLQ